MHTRACTVYWSYAEIYANTLNKVSINFCYCALRQKNQIPDFYETAQNVVLKV